MTTFTKKTKNYQKEAIFMSKNFKYSLVAIIAIVLMIAMSMTGVIVGHINGIANAATLQDEDAGLYVTRSVDVMTLGQIYQFAAEVRIGTEVQDDAVITWQSSNEDVAIVAENGVVEALSLGDTVITVSSEGYESIALNVQVIESSDNIVGIHFSQYMLALGVGETATIETESPYSVLTWTSENEEIATVENGEIKGVSVGLVKITASAINEETQEVASSSTCLVSVLPGLDASLMDNNSIVFYSVNADPETLTVSIPEGAEIASYEWYSLYSDVASVDPYDDDESICAIQPWRFGSTIITVIMTDTEGKQYSSYCNILVTSDQFFITGEQNGWISEPTDGWNMTEQVEGIYSIKTALWAYTGFQILHNDIDIDWTTKLTPYWYNGNQSNDNYVANTDQMFEVTTYGIYDVTLDLTQGIAKVSIVFEKAYTTSVMLDYAADSEDSLQEVDSYITLDIATLPTDSVYNPTNVRATVPEEYNTLISAQADGENMTVLVTLLQAIPSTGKVTLVPITVYIGEAYAEFDVVIIPLGATLTDVTSIEFSEESYELDVNNGADAAWEVPIRAFVNADASIQQVDYSVNSSNVYVDVDADGNAKLVAGALGTYTVTATSVGTTAEGEHLTKSVDVLIYSNAPYLIGTLNGETVNNWTALEPSVTSLTDTLFAPWALKPVDGSKAIYSITTDLNQNDVFSIVFLGMTGNWNGALRYANLNTADSDMQYLSENDNNVQILERAKYTITMDLTTANPSFTVKYAGEAEPGVDVDDLYVYILRAGDAWNGNATNVGNVLVASTEKVDVNEEGGIKTITLEYDFSNFGSAWPTIQFVTATEANAETGEFSNATWYNNNVTTVEFSGTAFIAGDVTENAFTNGGSGCQLWLEGSLQYNTVSFTFNFDIDGNITSIEMNYVVPVEA